MPFYWWNDAVAFARELAAGTHIKHRVKRGGGAWLVEPVMETAPGQIADQVEARS